jgi:hypothetical protein
MNLLLKMAHGCGRGLRNNVAAIAQAFVDIVTAHAVNAQSNGRDRLGSPWIGPAPISPAHSRSAPDRSTMVRSAPGRYALGR